MRVLPYSIFSALIGLSFSGFGQAQQPKPSATPAPANLMSNNGFETVVKRDNPWPGVSQAGYLEGQRGTAPVLTLSGTVGDSAMPVSAALADMNGDKKPDIVTADVPGYYRVYFNQGTEKEPKFGDAELVPIFLSRTDQEQYRFIAPRITVGDFAKSGKNDILVGNYIGQILWLKNQGAISAPDFRQPKTVASLLLPTTKNPLERWGNVFAPTTWDWNKDGKFDILLGEGSYSANNIHLLLNQGTSSIPKFEETNRYFLAYGDGHEQLTPAVVDYNGDGKPDILVADRSGKIGLYLNDWPNWKPGDEIKFVSYIPIQGQAGRDLTFGGICTVGTGDLNGDGLFDLIVGKANGRMAVAYNTGTDKEPKFDPPVELKAEKPGTPLQLPSGWDVDFGFAKGNFFAYATTVTEEDEPNLNPPENKRVLKFGYFPNSNSVIKTPLTYLPALNPSWNSGNGGGRGSWENFCIYGPANYVALHQTARAGFIPGNSYVLSFKIKGSNVSDSKVAIHYGGFKKLGESKVTRGNRGSARVQQNQIEEDVVESQLFNPSTGWTTVTKEFKVVFKQKELNDSKLPTGGANITISTALTPGKGELYIDDVQLTEKK